MIRAGTRGDFRGSPSWQGHQETGCNMRRSFWKAGTRRDLGTRYLPGASALGMSQAGFGRGGNTPFLTLLSQCSHCCSCCPQHPPATPIPPRWCHTGPGTAPAAGGATWGHHGDPVPCFGVSEPAVPPYLHQGAQGLHVGLLGVQQRHDDVFPHVLPGEKTHGCFGVTRGGGAACRGCLGRLNTGAARLEPSSPALPLQPDGGIRED